MKSAREAIESGAENKDVLVRAAVARLYRAASKNIIKDNTASRHVSRLMKALVARAS